MNLVYKTKPIHLNIKWPWRNEIKKQRVFNRAAETRRNKKKAKVPVPTMEAVEEPAAVVVKKKEGEKKMIFTKEDVAKHKYEHDVWIIVNGKVYDCTKYSSQMLVVLI
jgi:cytochrome b involved in lipid metabolism